jgi:exopolysaccharide biosynthesis protein
LDVSSKKVTYQPICNIAIVTCAPTTLKYAVTSTVLGTTKGKQEDISKKDGALMAVNGESTSAATAMAIRNGQAFMPNGDGRDVMRLYKNGKCDYGPLNKQNQSQLIKDGVYNTVRYHYVLVKDGKKITNNESY